MHIAQPVHLALVAKTGNPADLINDIHNLITQTTRLFFGRDLLARLVVRLAHADIPLIHEAEDEFRLAAPASWIAVRVRIVAIQHAFLFQRFDHAGRNFKNAHPAELTKAIHEYAVFVQRRDDGQVEFLTEMKVFRATARRDVNETGPFGIAYIFPQNDAMRLRRARRRAADMRAQFGRDVPANLYRGRQFVEGTDIFPTFHLLAGQLAQYLVRAL